MIMLIIIDFCLKKSQKCTYTGKIDSVFLELGILQRNHVRNPHSTFKPYILPHDSNEHPRIAIQLDLDII